MTYKRWQGPTRPVSNGAAVLRLTLGSDDDAPGHARAALGRLRGQTDEDVLERAVLLTSELVSNSVKHAGSAEIRVDIWPNTGSVAVVVTDDGPGFVPVAQPATVADQDGGFGLPLLDTLSEAWGSGCDGEAWVWFEVSPRIIARPLAVPARQPATEREQLLDIRMVVDSVKNHALVALDAAGNVTNWGAGAVTLTGYSAEELLGRPFSDLYVQASEQSFERERIAVESDGWHRVQRWIRRKDGSAVWAEVALAPIVDGAGNRRGLSALITDATEHKRIHDSNVHLISELREQAMTDDLTGLPNRRCWTAELNRELARSRRHGTPLAIVMLDLNGFKAFNDKHGHPAGDELLRAVARDWSEALRATDMLARFGGDEFSITLPDCSPELAIAVVGRVRAATPPRIDSSAGIASSNGAETADELVGRADAALYDAKRQDQAVSVAVTNP
jgi:diguanylate cyclase (GGDEF)-like protein/PAS domain S-box-containing protein